MTCIFCNRMEPEACVCSDCAQRIILFPIDKLKDAYDSAIDKGMTEKAEYLDRYLEEVSNEQGESKNRKFSDRRGFMRTSRYQPKRPFKTKKRARLSVPESYEQEQDLS